MIDTMLEHTMGVLFSPQVKLLAMKLCLLLAYFMAARSVTWWMDKPIDKINKELNSALGLPGQESIDKRILILDNATFFQTKIVQASNETALAYYLGRFGIIFIGGALIL